MAMKSLRGSKQKNVGKNSPYQQISGVASLISRRYSEPRKVADRAEASKMTKIGCEIWRKPLK
jgi:hypothetical protein